jgi:iron complex outermembrane recepter protein
VAGNLIFRSMALAMAIFGCESLAMAAAEAGVPTESQSAPPSSASATSGTTILLAATSDTESGQLEDVVVTARRVQENLQNVPVAVTVFSGAALREQNVVSIEDLNAKVPSLQTSNSSGDRDQVVFSIRGLTQSFGGSAPSVVMYFADVPTVAAGPSLLYDLDNLEVLKGPQGTLFGRNTTGGAILLNPQRPLNEFGGYVDVSGGNYGLVRAQAALNAPIIDDKLLVRFAIDENHREGFTTDLQTGDKLDGIHYRDFRISVIAKPFDGLENYLVYDQDNSNTHGGGTVLTALAAGSLATVVTPGIVNYYSEQQARGIRTVDYDTGADFDIIETQALTDVLSYAFSDDLLLKGIYGYRQYVQHYTSDSDATPYPYIQLDPSPNGVAAGGAFGFPAPFTTQTGELQLQGKSFAGNMPWTVGTYYEHTVPYSTTQIDDIVILSSNTLQQSLRYDSSKAAYGQASYHLDALLPGLTVTGGLRYTKDARELASRYFDNGVCTQLEADASCQRRQDADFSALTYTSSVEYQLNHDTLVYATTRKGYKAGGINSTLPSSFSSTVFQPETVRDAEVGIKSDFKVGSTPARLNADYYHMAYDNIQLTQTLVDPVTHNIYTATENAADATIQGVEIEGLIIPLRGFEISGFYAYIDAKYDSMGFIGKPFYNIPRSKVGGTVKYDLPIGSAGIISPGANYTYQSMTHVSNTPDATDVQGGYGLLDAHLDWRGIFGSKLDLSAFATNVTNKVYMVYQINLYSQFGFNDALFGAPRMFGVRAHYSF